MMKRDILFVIFHTMVYAVGVFVGGSFLILCWRQSSNTEELEMSIAQSAKAEAEAMSGLGGQYIKLWGDDGVKAKGIRFIVPGRIRQVSSTRYKDKRQFETKIIVLDGEIVTRGEVEQIDNPRAMMWSFSTQTAKQYKAAMKAHTGDSVAVLQLTPAAAQVAMEPWTLVSVVEGMTEADAGEFVKQTDWSDE